MRFDIYGYPCKTFDSKWLLSLRLDSARSTHSDPCKNVCICRFLRHLGVSVQCHSTVGKCSAVDIDKIIVWYHIVERNACCVIV